MLKILSGLLLLSSLPALAALPKGSVDLWATKFTWMAKDKTSSAALRNEIKKIAANSRAFDPDCFYNQPKDKCTDNADAKTTAELDLLAAVLSKETNGAFNVNREKDGKTFRDFGGLAQGFIMEKMKPMMKGPWAGNFSGDMYISEKFPQSIPLIIADHEITDMRYATVTMSSGWLLGTSAPAYGSKVVDPATKKLKTDSDFAKIVLFAKPEFSGARLDAWSTALIVGGKDLLKKLWENKDYEGKWAYMYIDAKNRPTCSRNLQCNLLTKDGVRTVAVPW